MTLAEIGRLVNGSVYGNRKIVIKNIAPPEDAGKGDLTFLLDASYKTRAGSVIANKKIQGKNGVVVKKPRTAMYLLLKKLSVHKQKNEISLNAFIHHTVSLPRSCSIGPFTVVKKNARIGKRTSIGAQCYIDEGVIIGEQCEIMDHTIIYRHSTIGDFVIVGPHTVIGKEGFGYIKRKRYERLRHIGGVVVEQFVEIGGNVTIDRGTIGNTVIKEGTKIDNLVHIGHNARIGKNCILMGQVGIAGSARIGNNVVLCGQVGISDHIEIEDNVIVYAKSAVFKSLSRNKNYSGIPAREHRAVLRALARLYKES
jgi:UDP-3-O-[3-hydroxymyristoyl] glucosamine N-acyltransferase